MHACATAGERLALPPQRDLSLPWLLVFLSTHGLKLLLELGLFVLSVLFVWSKHSTLVSMPLYIARDSLQPLAPM